MDTTKRSYIDSKKAPGLAGLCTCDLVGSWSGNNHLSVFCENLTF